MKLILFVFLGLCAISAQAYPSVNENGRGLVPDSIHDLVKLVKSEVDKINQESQTTLVILKDIVKSIIYQGVQLVSDKWATVNAKLDKLRHGGDKAKNCVEKYTPALETAKEEMKLTINNCTEKLVNETNAIKMELLNGVEMVMNNTMEFYRIVDECASFNPIKTAKCIYNNLGNYKDFVINSIVNAKNKLVEIKDRAQNASTEAATCTANAAFEFGEVESQITKLMHECMQERHTTATPEEQTTPKEVATPEPEVEETQATETPEPEVEETQATETPEPEVEETQATEAPEPEAPETQAPEEIETPAPEEIETPAPEEAETQEPEVENTEAPEEVETEVPEE